MAKHRAGARQRWVIPVVAVLGVAGLAVAGLLAVLISSPSDDTDAVSKASCERPVRVVTATSFAPVLAALTTRLAEDDDCLKLEVTTADGRAAVKRAAEVNADAWIPDDSSWAGTAGSLGLAAAPAAGAGAVLATSPLYMVADKATGTKLAQAGDTWLGLSKLVEDRKAKLVVRDPGGTGDGMVGAAAVAEAVWLKVDMDASALWLADAQQATRTVTGTEQALPAAGEVGVVPEYALLADPAAKDLTAVPGKDFTAMLRYTWLPLAAAAADPGRAAMLERLRVKLTGEGSADLIRSARLRTPDDGQGAGTGGGDAPFPAPTAKPLPVLGPHHVDHVFATWYAGDRQTNLLVVVDISGSMAGPARGTNQSRIELVRQGCRSVAALLPDESRMGLWEFGSRIDGAKDYKSLLGMTALNAGHRKALGSAVSKLDARETGTGLYDTILAAYTSARDSYQGGVPNQVLLLTDGRNEADDGSLTAAQLTAGLKKAEDKDRPVSLSVVTFGTTADAEAINKAVEPVGGYVDNLTSATEVAAVFIHVAAGGLHH